jgi:hypothetical protein
MAQPPPARAPETWSRSGPENSSVMGNRGDAPPGTSNGKGLGVLIGRHVKVYPELLRWETHRLARRPDRRWTTLEHGADGEPWVSGPTGRPLILYGGGFIAKRRYCEPVHRGLYFEAEGDRLHLTVDGTGARSICATPETVRALGGHERTALMWMSAWASASEREAVGPPVFVSRDRLPGQLSAPGPHPMTIARPLVGRSVRLREGSACQTMPTTERRDLERGKPIQDEVL